MLKVNDYVVCGATGVCQIMDIITDNFGGKTDREYYVLNPVYTNGSTIYIPTDSDHLKMRRLMTRDEIYALINIEPDMEREWISDDQLRKAVFAETVQSCKPQELIKLVKTLYRRQAALKKEGKKLLSADISTLKSAEQLLYCEFALVLDIQPDQVASFITGQIKA
ncbi:MAG: CarD family transcriptional regulator [Clostridiaceae bacterium]|nr:CarD family transcriptional regulator [Clostridiaceae bacterium]